MGAPSAQDIFDLAKAEMQDRRTDLSFTEGDISEMVAAGIMAVGDRIVGWAAERFKATYVDGAEEDDLTTLADDHWSIDRQVATKSTGILSVTRGASPGLAGTIDAGSVFSTVQEADGSEVQFETTADLIWGAGESGTKTVTINAVEGGRTGNVAASTITRVITTLFDTFTCTNAAMMAGGADAETDEALKERIREYPTVLRRATLAALEYGAKQVAGVTNATAVEDSIGLVTVYITDEDGQSNASLVADVTAELEDWRAAGSVVTVTGGALYELTVSIVLTVRAGVDTAAIVTDVKTAIVARLDKLKIGETCTRELIQQAALNVSDQILGVTVTLPAANVAPSAYQVIRTATGLITVA